MRLSNFIYLPAILKTPNLLLSTKKGSSDKFTGGDGFEGLNLLYHQIMMKNELNDGKDAYKLSFAGHNSGFSFGGNQMDMKQNPAYIDIFVDILEKATDINGNKICSVQDIQAITGDKNVNLAKFGQSIESIFGNNISKINAALSSDYGKQKINAAYQVEIPGKAAHVETIIDSMQNPAAKAFYSTDLGKALLFDYHNQYNLSPKQTFLEEYIDGEANNKERIHYTTKEPFKAPTDVYTFADHEAYIMSTKQYSEMPKSCSDRLTVVCNTIFQAGNLWEDFTLPDFSVIWLQKSWKVISYAKLPSFQLPEMGENRLKIYNLDNVVSPEEPLQAGSYYYFADNQHLFQLNGPMQPGPPPAYPQAYSWTHVTYFLVRHEEIKNPQLSQELESKGLVRDVDYDKFELLVTKHPVSIDDLVSWVGKPLFNILELKSLDGDQQNAISLSFSDIVLDLPVEKKGLTESAFEDRDTNSSNTHKKMIYVSIDNSANILPSDFHTLVEEKVYDQTFNPIQKLGQPLMLQDIVSMSSNNTGFNNHFEQFNPPSQLTEFDKPYEISVYV